MGKCRNCRHSLKVNWTLMHFQDAGLLKCRVNPPHAVKEIDGISRIDGQPCTATLFFPVVKPDDGCAAFIHRATRRRTGRADA